MVIVCDGSSYSSHGYPKIHLVHSTSFRLALSPERVLLQKRGKGSDLKATGTVSLIERLPTIHSAPTIKGSSLHAGSMRFLSRINAYKQPEKHSVPCV